MSSFAWLDYSAKQKQTMLDLIEKFREQETRDELGIGIARDAFADMLFPGTSTIQRRARYFLFVPWTYMKLERNRVPSEEIAKVARKEEVELIKVLSALPEVEGVIGQRAGANLQRLPSSIYWSGLRTWKILLFSGSQEEYHRWLDTYYRRNTPARNDDKEPIEGSVEPNWHWGIPDAPAGFPKGALPSFKLTYEEASYLRGRVSASVRNTMLGFMLEEEMESEGAGFPWEHPRLTEFPSQVRVQLHHARNFSEAMHGAALLYNLMLAEKSDNEERRGFYENSLATWKGKLDDRASELLGWDRDEFWRLIRAKDPRISQRTQSFINEWLRMVRSALQRGGMIDMPQAKLLIARREYALKGSLARLSNPTALRLWNGAAGTSQLNYRWGNARRIIDDIVSGLTEGLSAC